MDSFPLVDSQIDAGQRLLNRLIENGFDVTAACWVTTADQSGWDLYIVSKTVDVSGPQQAHFAMHPFIWGMRPPLVDPLSVRVTGTTSSVGADLSKLRQRLPEGGTWYHGGLLGNLPIEQAYIYPTAASASRPTPEEVARKVLDLMNRPGPAAPSGVHLRDGTSFQGTPFGVELSEGTLQAKFVAVPTGLPRVVAVKDIAAIE